MSRHPAAFASPATSASTRRRISIDTHMPPACGLDIGIEAGAGCEPEVSTKAAPQLPVFAALSPPPVECSLNRRRTHCLLHHSFRDCIRYGELDLHSAAHLYQHLPAACMRSKHWQWGWCV